MAAVIRERTSMTARAAGVTIGALALMCSVAAERSEPVGSQQPQDDCTPYLPSNECVGIDIDRFIGSPSAAARVTHEVMLTRSILRAGDPHAPGEPAAVLPYRKDFALATLLPNNVTPMVELPLQQILFVESGSGSLDDGTLYWDLRPGIATLIPAKLRHRLRNTGDSPLTMLMVTWENPAEVTPRKDILVRDVNLLPFARRHWGCMPKQLFFGSDGLHPNERILVVYVSPLSMCWPHAHPPNWEEVWTNMGPDSSLLMLGSELREMPVNTGFISPPNGRTAHSVLNTSKDRIQAYFYFARFTMPWPVQSGGSEGTVAGRSLPRSEIAPADRK